MLFVRGTRARSTVDPSWYLSSRLVLLKSHVDYVVFTVFAVAFFIVSPIDDETSSPQQ